MTPVNPPPRITPRCVDGVNVVSENALRPFIGRYLCMALKDGNILWYCPTAVGEGSLTGYVWLGYEWERRSLELDRIDKYC